MPMQKCHGSGLEIVVGESFEFGICLSSFDKILHKDTSAICGGFFEKVAGGMSGVF